MSSLPSYEQWLFFIQIILLLGLLARMLLSGLHGVYRYFFVYIAVQLLQSLVPVFFSYRDPVYARLFIGTEAIMVCLYPMIVLELYSLALDKLPGIARTSRRYIRVACGMAIIVSLALLTVQRTPNTLLQQFDILERTVVCSLMLFVVFITAFLLYYPIPLHRNVTYYSMGYFVFFGAETASLFLGNVGPVGWKRVLSALILAASDACLLFWIIALNRQGETATVVPGHKWRPEDEQRLLRDLEAINAGLMRARK